MSRILFLSAWVPFPMTNGSRLRIYNLLRGLAETHELTLIALAEPGDNVAPELSDICRRVHLVPRRPYNPTSVSSFAGLFQPAPRAITATHQPRMARAIRDEIAGGRHNLIVASELGTACYHHCFGATPALFEDAEFGAFEGRVSAAANGIARARHQLTLLKLRAYLRSALHQFGACTVPSDKEGELLRAWVPDYNDITTIPNCVSLADYELARATPEPDSLIFTGSLGYDANREAVQWFLDEVFPAVRAERPAARLTVTGDSAGYELRLDEGVIATGMVPDVRPLVAQSWASVAPLRSGGGTRLKVLESLAIGTPVVATTKGAEGIDARNDEHLLLADEGAGFARAVVGLLADPAKRDRLARSGRELVARHYDWAGVMPRFLQLIDELTVAGR